MIRTRFAVGVLVCVSAWTSCGFAKTVALGMPDNHTEVSLNLGDSLMVDLPSGSVKGFSWMLHLPKVSAVTALSNDEMATGEGTPQLRRFRFNAAVTGDTLVVFGFETEVKIPGVASEDASAYSVLVHVASGAPREGTAVLLGVYKGTLPCADCSGLETTLRLYAKGKFDTTYAFFVRTQTYRGAPHGDVTYSDRGDWALLRGDATDPDATVYQLNPDVGQQAESLLVQEGGAALVQLDRQQRRIDSKMNLTLRRVGQ